MSWNQSQLPPREFFRVDNCEYYLPGKTASDRARSAQQNNYQRGASHDSFDLLIDPELRGQSQEFDEYLSLSVNTFGQQQPSLERYFQEQERRPLFTTPNPSQLPQVQRMFTESHSAPIGTVPQAMASQYRMNSPAPSQGMTSACSSQSPGTDFETYHDPYVQDGYAPMSNFPSTWNTPAQSNYYPPQSQMSLQSQSHVNLNQVQNFADVDQQQDAFEAQDEGYEAISMRGGLSVHPDSYKHENNGYYTYPRDEALGASIKDHNSPQGIVSVHNDNNSAASPYPESDGEVDAEGDDVSMVGEAIATEHEVSDNDTDYSPRSRRKSARTPRKSTSSFTAPVKSKSRVTKTTKSASGNNLSCKTCSSSFKDNASLQRHIAKEHTRAFTCVFSFGGCEATFGSKNEWKRHVQSQHTNFTAWVCKIGTCGQPTHKNPVTANGIGAGAKGVEFNRKDLFTQHVRRMHTPIKVKKAGQPNAPFEEYLKKLQTSCLVQKRRAPTRLNCPAQGCTQKFEGSNCWDERMEHVGKHLEKMVAGASGKGPGGGGRIVDQERDGLLVQWALNERVIERKIGGGYQMFTGNGTSNSLAAAQSAGTIIVNGYADGEDEDAEGEDE